MTLTEWLIVGAWVLVVIVALVWGARRAEAQEKELEAGEALAMVQQLGARIHDFRTRIPPDSPLQPMAYQAASLCGEMEARVRAKMLSDKKDGQKLGAPDRRSDPRGNQSSPRNR